jgi:hypothetical protein
MALPSPAGNGAAESAWLRCYRVLLVTALLSPTRDGTTEVMLIMA